MLANLIFFILALFVIALGPEAKANGWIAPWMSFFLGCALYGVTLGVILLQQRLFKRKTALFLAETELVIFLIVYHFLLVSQRVIPSFFFQALFSICLYLAGLAVAHAKKEHALILLPFALPFLFLTGITELIPIDYQGLILIIATLIFIASVLLFFPPVIKRLWRCKKMEDKEMEEELLALAKRAHFKHGGIYTWTVMNHVLTAGIIGVLPRFRYVLFSKRVLEELPQEQIEAILAHEIGHTKYKHLIIFPLIFLGLMAAMALFSYLFGEAIDRFVAEKAREMPLSWWPILSPFAILIPYGLMLVLYIRYVFGYFSRLFERQADLYTLTLGLKPNALIDSLDHIGIHTGFTHKVPSWHHWSIQERIDALKQASEHPELIQKHNRRVFINVIAYLVILAGVILFLVW